MLNVYREAVGALQRPSVLGYPRRIQRMPEPSERRMPYTVLFASMSLTHAGDACARLWAFGLRPADGSGNR